MDLRFCDYILETPKHDEDECRDKDLTFAAPLKINVELEIKETGEIKEQQLFFGDFPLMTERGTFIVNGAERVVVSQLVRSPGVYYTADPDPQTGKILGAAKLIPSRGAWLEFETSNRNILSVKVDRKRKIPASILIRTIDVPGILPGDYENPTFSKYFELLKEEGAGDGKRSTSLNRATRELEEHLGTTDRLLAIFKDVDIDGEEAFLRSTIEVGKDNTVTKREALIEFYRRIRPGEPPTLENARKLIDDQLFFKSGKHDVPKKLEKLVDQVGIVLEEALNKNYIFGAGIDVFEKEPPDINNPLLKNKKMFLSPHTAPFTKECMERMGKETIQNIIDFFERKLDKSMIVKL